MVCFYEGGGEVEEFHPLIPFLHYTFFIGIGKSGWYYYCAAGSTDSGVNESSSMIFR